MEKEEIKIPNEILEIEKQIRMVTTKDELLSLKHTIVKATAENVDTFSYLQKVYIRQKRKLCEA